MQYNVRMNELAYINNINADTIFPNQVSMNSLSNSSGPQSPQQRLAPKTLS
ncbi:MAG: hypothetical protein ACK521_12545 [bacterium]